MKQFSCPFCEKSTTFEEVCIRGEFIRTVIERNPGGLLYGEESNTMVFDHYRCSVCHSKLPAYDLFALNIWLDAHGVEVVPPTDVTLLLHTDPPMTVKPEPEPEIEDKPEVKPWP
jgi:hypothetical protein